MSAETVIWHDLECGGYAADLPFWRALARRHGGPVLDVGAGTGRVALVLARDGLAVIALEHDRVLADELARRAAGSPSRSLRGRVRLHPRGAGRARDRAHADDAPARGPPGVPALRPRRAAPRRPAGRRAPGRGRRALRARARAGCHLPRRRALREHADRAAAAARRGRARAPPHALRAGAPAPRWTASRLRGCDADARRARRPAAGFAPGACRDRPDARARRQRIVCLEAVSMRLRVCALYPDLMNIYADRGNLLMLERRCAWRGIGWRAARGGLGEAAARRARPLLHRRRPGRRPAPLRRGPGAPQGGGAARRGGARRRRARRMRRLPAARPLLRARRARRFPASGCSTCAPSARRAAPDRQHRAAQRPRASSSASRTMRAAPSSGPARSRSAGSCAATATTAAAASRGRARQRDRDLRARAAAAQERVAVRLAHGPGARGRAGELAPLDDALETAAHEDGARRRRAPRRR